MDMILGLCCLLIIAPILFGIRAGSIMAEQEMARMQTPHPNIWEQKEEDEDTFFFASIFMGEKDS